MLELIEIGNKLVGRKRQVVAEKFGWIFYYCVFLNTVRCPFCKTPNYAVEYRGVKTKEEKGIEQVEEQRVIEAKIRMMENEKQDYEDKLQKRMESCSSSISAMTGEFEQCSASEPATPSSSSGGLACAIAALAERQKMVGKSSNHSHNVNVSSYSMLPDNYDIYYDIEQETDDTDDHHHHNNHYHNSNEMGETGSNISYVSSYMNGESFHNFPHPPPGVIASESFEEQMMMSMAVSLEVHATTTSAPTEVSWQ
ncbi:unnamed protein product [Brassica oleracea var. botrytis]|uniref:Uncharacterized protein n=2 Tax=Brassica oleracea TaxID=3712 RepID=A0A0D3CVZ2_BRAOL|nr:unnamed protein product [Brassica oleracea]